MLCKVYKKETSRHRDHNQAEEIRNVRNRGEVETGSVQLCSAYSLPVNHGSIHHPIMQPGVTSHGSSSIRSASEDPYQGFRGEVQTSFVAAPPLPDGYINNDTTVVLRRSRPVSTSTDEFQNLFQDLENQVCVQSGSNQQSVVMQDATDRIPQPCDYDTEEFSLDLLDCNPPDDLDKITSEIVAMTQVMHSVC